MSRRCLIALAATCAAGVLAVPGTALAAGSTHPRPFVPAQPVHAAPLNSITKPVISGFTHTVTTPVSGSSARSAAAEADASALGFTVTATRSNGAYDAQLSLGITGSTAAVTVSVSWDGAADAPRTTAGDGTVAIGHTFSSLGVHTVTVSMTDGTQNVSSTGTVTPIGTDYTAYGPTRLLDTRSSKTTLKPYGTVKVKVGGNGGISTAALAAVLNLTVTNGTKGGYITAWADGSARPASSNVNFAAGQTVPNLSIVPVGDGGYVDLYNSSPGTVDLIADIDGYYSQTAAAGYTPVAPARLVDTRNGTGVAKAQIAPNASVPVQVAGKAGVPDGVTALAVNITATKGGAGGYVAAYPDGGTQPTASNVNYGAGQTIANAAVVPVGSDGRIRLANGSPKGVDVVVDVVGYYSAGSKGAYVPTVPTRLMDTRHPNNDTPGQIPAHFYQIYPFSTFVDSAATSVVLNVTVPTAGADGYLSVAPDPNTFAQYQNNTFTWATAPSTSTLNFSKGQSVPNLVQASTGSTGVLDFWNQSAVPADFVLDMFGVYLDN